MRLVAWNCCEKFASNRQHLEALAPDVAVISEGPGELDELSGRRASGAAVAPIPGSRKHLAVFALEPWTATPVHLPGAPTCAVPVAISGPGDFTLVGFWAGEPRRFGSYTGQLRAVIESVLPSLSGDVVIAGDFNAPIDSSQAAHQRNVDALAELGIVSAHTAGDVPEPTYYQHLREDQPFHIDHVFVPETWLPRAQLSIGPFDPWVRERRSDHVPLVLDLSPSPRSAEAVEEQAQR